MKRRTAAENIAALPAEAYAVLRSNGKLIVIKNGVSGYTPTPAPIVAQLMKRYNANTAGELAGILNKQEGVTPAQREALENGSMFGWDAPAANVENYNEEGKYIG